MFTFPTFLRLFDFFCHFPDQSYYVFLCGVFFLLFLVAFVNFSMGQLHFILPQLYMYI